MECCYYLRLWYRCNDEGDEIGRGCFMGVGEAIGRRSLDGVQEDYIR